MLEKLAPHLVRPVPFIYPLTHRIWERFYAGSGVALYDSMAFLSGASARCAAPPPPHRRGARRLMPALRKDALIGALHYYDGQVDDARHTMFLSRTAAAYGAHVASRTRVIALIREGDRVTGARVKDLETGDEHRRRARVRSSTPPGSGPTRRRRMAGERGQFHVRASKGIHLVVPRDRIRGESGLILRTEKSVLFVIPWGRHWIIGTTDTDWDLSKDHPAASRSDIDYLLEHVNRVLVQPLTHDDVQGVYAGLRPLLAGEDAATSKLSREHAVVHQRHGTRRHRRRQVHDLPDHGQGRRRRRRAVDGDDRTAAPCPSAAPRTSRCSAPTATRPCGTSGRSSPPRAGSASAASSTCSDATARSSPSCSS